MAETRRLVLACVLALIATAVHFVRGEPTGLIAGIWFIFAVGIGAVVAAWWALLFAMVPSLLLLFVTVARQGYVSFGEGWQAAMILDVTIGLIGIVVGLSARWIRGMGQG